MHPTPRRPLAIAVLTIASLASSAGAQSPCRLVKDINTATAAWASSNPASGRTGTGGNHDASFLQCGSSWFFVATTIDHGEELWKTDGTAAGTVRVADIHPGTGSSAPSGLECAGGRVYFAADDGRSGRELWCSDGTAAGTVLVADIAPGPASSEPGQIEAFGSRVYFSADDGPSGRELWSSDGTNAGTRLVLDIHPGAGSSHPQRLHSDNGNQLLFVADDGRHGAELWRTDGIASTTMVRDILPGSGSGSPNGFHRLGNSTVFAATGPDGREVWKTDGTATGTVQVKDIQSGAAGSGPELSLGAVLGSHLYFAADDGVAGRELWRTDGTSAGTTLFLDVTLGAWPSSFGKLHVNGSTLWFSPVYFDPSGASGWHLYRSDGTVPGTARIYTHTPSFSSAYPAEEFASFGTGVIFTRPGEPGYWFSGGTATYHVYALVDDIRSLTSLASGAVLFSGQLVYPRDDHELHVVDPRSGPMLFKDLDPTTFGAGSNPSGMHNAFGETLYFFADGSLWKWTAAGGAERLATNFNSPEKLISARIGGRALTITHNYSLVVTDGTTSGTRSIPGIDVKSDLTYAGGKVFFAGQEPLMLPEPYVSDGTVAGTKVLKDIRTGFHGSFPENFSACGARVFFAAEDHQHGKELWMSDGTAAGTVMVKDINPATLPPLFAFGSNPSRPVCCGDRVAFTADEGSPYAKIDREIYVSDGTSAGTFRLGNIHPTESSGIEVMYWHEPSKNLLFVADDGTSGKELWVSDLTTSGTRQLADIHRGSGSSEPSDFVTILDQPGAPVVFIADDGQSGRELWVTDMTVAGTKRLRDIHPGAAGSDPARLTATLDRMFFVADDGVNGRELWITDGTTGGTNLVVDLGTGSTDPSSLTALDGGVMFSAKGVWFSDGTAAGTKKVCAVSGSQFTICDGQVLFAGREPKTGTELWVHEKPGATREELFTGTVPRLASSDPKIGTNLRILGQGGAANATAVVAFSLPTTGPGPVPFNAVASSFVDPGSVAVAGILTGSSFRLSVPIPSDPRLVGGQVALQTWWVNSVASPTFDVSNGLRLTMR